MRLLEQANTAPVCYRLGFVHVHIIPGAFVPTCALHCIAGVARGWWTHPQACQRCGGGG